MEEQANTTVAELERIAEFYDRAINGQEMTEKHFDTKVLPGKLRELAAKYDIRMEPDQYIPTDIDMARRAFEAGVELLVEIGAYCIDCERVMPVSRDEIDVAIAGARPSHTIGAGAEAVEHVLRQVGDSRPVVVTGGANGAPLSEEYYLAVMKSVANEPVDALHTGALQGAMGLANRTRTPIEILACKKEAIWARQAVTEAGKPGMSVLGIMSGATSESQDAAHFEGALRPTDTHLVVFQNEVKFTYELLNKMLHDRSVGATVEACCCPIHGGYSGGAETTAITGIAEAILGYLVCRPANFSWYHQSLFTGSTTSREALWIQSMMALAFRAADVSFLVDTYVGPAAGPWTEMLCEEIAAHVVATSACGMAGLYGACGAKMCNVDRVTGLEARMLVETARAAAGMGLAEANQVTGRLLARYSDALVADAAPLGKTFAECYDGVEPKPAYVEFWEKQKKELAKHGLTL